MKKIILLFSIISAFAVVSFAQAPSVIRRQCLGQRDFSSVTISRVGDIVLDNCAGTTTNINGNPALSGTGVVDYFSFFDPSTTSLSSSLVKYIENSNISNCESATQPQILCIMANPAFGGGSNVSLGGIGYNSKANLVFTSNEGIAVPSINNGASLQAQQNGGAFEFSRLNVQANPNGGTLPAETFVSVNSPNFSISGTNASCTSSTCTSYVSFNDNTRGLKVSIGDVLGTNVNFNDTTFIVDDTVQQVFSNADNFSTQGTVANSRTSLFTSTGVADKVVSLGDFDIDGNGTSIILTDVSSRLDVNANDFRLIGSTASAIFSDTTQSLTYTGFLTFAFPRTITAGGTTGAQVINLPYGTVNFAGATSSLVVTNSTVDANSLIFLTKRTADATCDIDNVIAGAGTFTINMTANCTAETSVGFMVQN